MPTIANTIIKLALHLADASYGTWSAAEMTRFVTRVLEDLAQRGHGDQGYLDHLGNASARVDIDADMATIQQILAVEYPVGDDPPSYIPYALALDSAKETIVLLTDSLPDASTNFRMHFTLCFATVPYRHEALVLGGAEAYAYEFIALKLANSLTVDSFTGQRYRELARDKRAIYDRWLAELPPPYNPFASAPGRADWRTIDD